VVAGLLDYTGSVVCVGIRCTVLIFLGAFLVLVTGLSHDNWHICLFARRVAAEATCPVMQGGAGLGY
jgi:hypothetical protein